MISLQNESEKRGEVGTVFKIFTQTTTWILLLAAAFIGFTTFFGQPMDCWTSNEIKESEKNAFNSYCWLHASSKIDFEAFKKSCIKAQVSAQNIMTYH